MPYKSEAQRRYFHYLAKKGKISPETVNEFDDASRGEELPPKKMASGGIVDDSGEDEDPIITTRDAVVHETDEANKRAAIGSASHSFDSTSKFQPQYLAHGGFAKAILKKKRGY
jgi:hypothetical protein